MALLVVASLCLCLLDRSTKDMILCYHTRTTTDVLQVYKADRHDAGPTDNVVCVYCSSSGGPLAAHRLADGWMDAASVPLKT